MTRANRRWTPALVLGMTLLVGASARAEGWSAQAGQTIGTGGGLFWANFGWPGLSADLAYGVSPTLDLGGRFTFNYGEEGITDTGVLGLKFQFTLRTMLLHKPKFDLALRFPNSTTVVGMTFPVGLEMGFPINPKLRMAATFDLPFWVTFNDPARFFVPILFGGGVEYLVQHDLAVTFRLKMGPTIATGNFTRNTFFTLYVLGGIAYRF